jgi:hypothetical protein
LRGVWGARNRPREKTNFARGIKAIRIFTSENQNNTSVLQKSVLQIHHSFPQEGRVATVTSVGLECDGRGSCCRTGNRDADGEGVWSWHPWAGAKPSGESLQATVTNKVMDTGESTRISRNTIAQGKSV